MSDSRHLIGHANLVVKKAEILPVWDWETDAMGQRGKKFRTGEVVVRVTIKNAGKKQAGTSRTSIAFITAREANLLETLETPVIAEGREFEVESRRLRMSEPGALVILADAPVDGNPNGRVSEQGMLTSMAGELDNAFAFPFGGGEIEVPREYANPMVH